MNRELKGIIEKLAIEMYGRKNNVLVSKAEQKAIKKEAIIAYNEMKDSTYKHALSYLLGDLQGVETTQAKRVFKSVLAGLYLGQYVNNRRHSYFYVLYLGINDNCRDMTPIFKDVYDDILEENKNVSYFVKKDKANARRILL